MSQFKAQDGYKYLANPNDKKQRDEADAGIELLKRTLETGVQNRELNPLVELIPWRYCRFLLLYAGAEAWVELDGTLVIPIDGKFTACQSRVISGLVKDWYFRLLKRAHIYPDNTSPDITIGLDPECSVYKVVSGKGRISEHITAESIIGNRNCESRVGTDGFATIFEFRPKASTDVKEVTESVESCVKGLAYKLSRSGLTKVYAVMGGGCSYSLGGHVHIGNERIKKLSQHDLNQLGQMLDDFLYFPIRDRMAGAIRQWIQLPRISQQTFDGPMPTFQHIEDAKESLKNIERFGRTSRFASYDYPSQWRQKAYGYEYRSLPSFIVNKEFTETVLRMVQIIAEKFYALTNNGDSFEYNSPTSMRDYLLLFPRELARTFHKYINGDKRDIFMDNAFTCWNIQPEIYKIFVPIKVVFNGGRYQDMATYDSDDTTEIGEHISRRFHTLLRRAYGDDSLPAHILFNSTVSGNASFSIYSRGMVVHRNGTQGAPLNLGIIEHFPQSTIIQHGSALRKGGMIHAVKQALIMDLSYRVGRTAPRKYERMCEIIRKWMPETENTYGAIITSGFGHLNQD